MILRLSHAPEPPRAHYSARSLKKTGKTNLAGQPALIFSSKRHLTLSLHPPLPPHGGAAIASWLVCIKILARFLIIIEGWPIFAPAPLLVEPDHSDAATQIAAELQRAFRSRCDWDQAGRPVRGRRRDEAQDMLFNT